MARRRKSGGNFRVSPGFCLVARNAAQMKTLRGEKKWWWCAAGSSVFASTDLFALINPKMHAVSSVILAHKGSLETGRVSNLDSGGQRGDSPRFYRDSIIALRLIGRFVPLHRARPRFAAPSALTDIVREWSVNGNGITRRHDSIEISRRIYFQGAIVLLSLPFLSSSHPRIVRGTRYERKREEEKLGEGEKMLAKSGGKMIRRLFREK